MLVRTLVLAFAAAAAASAQGFSFGAKLGLEALDAFSGVEAGGVEYRPSSAGYVFGGAVELRLPLRLGVEANLLYRPIGYSAVTPNAAIKQTATQWQFPILLKYRLRPGLVAPFAAGGISFQHLTGAPSAPEAVETSATGAVFGAGLEGGFPLFRLSGELRYTRWGSSMFRIAGADLSNQNQLELLVGVAF
jgi:hypothetical protein